MKNRLPFLFLAWAVLAAGQGHALPTFPDTTQGSSTSSTSPSGLGPVHTDGKCHFRIKESEEGHYYMKGYTFFGDKNDPISWGFGFTCYAGASPEEIDEQLHIARKDGKIVWNATGEPFSPEQHFEMQRFSGKNWTGTAVSYDMTTGPEESRGRFFLFCLVETGGVQALCGQVQGLTAGTINAEINIKKIMDVIKTIEFVDLPSGQPASSQSISR
ncbi:MAG: hypothetical protein QJR11_09350 [Fulvimonas sp.]|nr:hypothetical protein [Fulvimonas sp.]